MLSQNGMAEIISTPHFTYTILLAVIGIGIISNQKTSQQTGFGALIILTIALCIMGYYDYWKWFSSIVGVFIFIYFVILIIIKKKISNKN